MDRRKIIYQDDAIDALCKSECGCNNAECRHRDNTDFCVTCDSVNIIKSLPSVQPETNCSEIPNNSDTISRQAAIEPEAISKWKKEFREYVDSLDIARDDWKGIIEYIDELPSIQLGTNLAEVGTDLVSRQAAVDTLRKMQTYKLFAGDDMILIDKAQVQTELMMLPPAEPERGKWILDRSGAYCCDKCMEPCATYAMMKPRDKFCKMCGAKMDGERKE